MIAGTMIDGHILLSDWLLLIAAIVFVVAAIAVYVRQPGNDAKRDVVPSLVPLGLALFALGFWVL